MVKKNCYNFCKYIDVFILNGRICEDKEIGKFTCKNISVVDYIIASAEYLKHITNLQVLEFSKLLSDVHCPISIFIDHVKQFTCMRSSSNIIADKNVDKKPRRWENSKYIIFLENLDLELMNDLENSVNNFSPENCSQAISVNIL